MTLCKQKLTKVFHIQFQSLALSTWCIFPKASIFFTLISSLHLTLRLPSAGTASASAWSHVFSFKLLCSPRAMKQKSTLAFSSQALTCLQRQGFPFFIDLISLISFLGEETWRRPLHSPRSQAAHISILVILNPEPSRENWVIDFTGDQSLNGEFILKRGTNILL